MPTLAALVVHVVLAMPATMLAATLDAVLPVCLKHKLAATLITKLAAFVPTLHPKLEWAIFSAVVLVTGFGAFQNYAVLGCL